jgi:O-antigen/teichoic acid export membrane protein
MLFKLFRNDYSLNIINKIYTVVIGLLSSVFLTRYLGVIYRGDFSYIIQIVLIFSIILNFGVNQSYSYFYKKYNGKVFNKFLNLYVFQFLTQLIISIVLGILFRNYIYFYVCMMVPFNVFSQQMESTMAVENIRLKIKLNLVNVTIKMLAYGLMFLFLDGNLLYPVLITIGINITTVIIYMYFSNALPIPPKTNFSFMREVLIYSWLPMVTSLLLTFNYSIDILLLKHMGSAVELGLYSTAVGIINYFWLLPDAFKEVLVSRVARTSSLKSTILSIKLSIYSLLMMILLFFLLGRLAIEVLYGSEFSNAYLVTLLLSFGALSMVFFKIIGVVFLSEGKRWFFFFTLFISVIINILANCATIPKFGMYGAAFSTLISYTICGVAFLFYFLKVKNIKFYELVIISSSEMGQLKKIIGR